MSNMFDAQRFLVENFRSPAELCARFTALGLPAPKDATVSKWFSRDSVPVGWMARLLALVELEDGAPMSLSKYVRYDE